MPKTARNNKPKFRLKFKELTETLKLESQREMAKLLGVHPSVVCNYSSGRGSPSLRTVVDFALVLNLKSLDELVEIPGLNAKEKR